jgi:hypothetical protein
MGNFFCGYLSDRLMMVEPFRLRRGRFGSNAVIFRPRSLKVVNGEVVAVQQLETGDLEPPMEFNWVAAIGLCIPRSIECIRALTSGEPTVHGEIGHVTFESNSRLTRIESHWLLSLRITSICVPPRVTFISPGALSGRISAVFVDFRNQNFFVDGGFLMDLIDFHLVHYIGDKQTIVVPDRITALTAGCFGFISASSITFGPNSQLKRIENGTLDDFRLQSICLPRNLEFVSSSALRRSIKRISVDPRNGRFAIENNCLTDIIDRRLVRYIGQNDKILIQSHIKELGEFCFRLSEITSVKFETESELMTIGKHCFEGCALREIMVPDKVAVLGEGCFCGNHQLGSLSFGGHSQLKRIDDSCFRGCPLSRISIPRSVELLGSAAFAACSRLRLVDFEADSRLVRIGGECFQGCPLGAVCIPRRVEFLGESCFDLPSISFCITFESPSSLRVVSDRCFHNCDLKSIAIPRSVESLGGCSFASSRRLGTVTFESDSNLLSLGDCCFCEAISLTAIRIPKRVAVLGKGCFEGCCRLKEVTFEAASALQEVGEHCFRQAGIKSIRLPQAVEVLADAAFHQCARLTNVAFEDGCRLRTIGGSCFTETQLVAVSIPANVEVIKRGAFMSYTFYSGVLREVTFEPNAHLKEIEEQCFASCSIEEIVIPRSVEVLGTSCFRNDRSQGTLARLEFEGDSMLREIGASCFAASVIRSVVIPRRCEVLRHSAFAGTLFSPSPLERLVFEGGARLGTIEEKCFAWCSLRSVVIPGSVRLIGKAAFARNALEEVAFGAPSELDRIEDASFANNHFNTIHVPRTVGFVAPAAFDPGVEIIVDQM